jgi:FkbM family methyltransferase
MQNMIKSFLIQHDIVARGLMHIGAHEGQESSEYSKLDVENVIYVEAIPDVYTRLKGNVSQYKGHHAVCAVCSAKVGDDVEFNVASNEQSSSILALSRHADIYPEVYFKNTLKLKTDTADNVAKKFKIEDVNVLVIDTQGAEIQVLTGAKELLKYVDLIYIEVSDLPLYEGACTLQNVIDFLKPLGFNMRWLQMNKFGWGDGVFVHERNAGKLPPKIEIDGVNVALDKQATQSSMPQWAQGSPATNAINGKKTGSYAFHTEFEDHAWWEVDLGQRFEINDILIYNRLDAGKDRSQSLKVVAGDGKGKLKEIYAPTGGVFGGIDGYPLHIQPKKLSARIIRIELTEPNCLHLDQVEIFGRPL